MITKVHFNKKDLKSSNLLVIEEVSGKYGNVTAENELANSQEQPLFHLEIDWLLKCNSAIRYHVSFCLANDSLSFCNLNNA